MIYREDFTLPSEFLELVSQQERTGINFNGKCSVNSDPRGGMSARLFGEGEYPFVLIVITHYKV
jgi:hypothetical protein